MVKVLPVTGGVFFGTDSFPHAEKMRCVFHGRV